MLNKQAKTLTPKQTQRLLDHVSHTRYPDRNRVIVLLSFKAGLRAVEIAGLRWSMVTDASGELGDHIALPNRVAKGKSGGRTIPMNAGLHAALLALREAVPDKVRADWPIAYSERGGYSAASIVNLFDRWYRELGFQGASSHSGRRTFITAAAIEPIRTPAMHHVEEQGRQAARAPECLEIMSRLPFSAFPWSTKKCASALFRRAADAL